MSVGTPITVTVPPTGGVGTLPTVQYTAEIEALTAIIKTMTAEMIIINREIGVLSTALSSIASDLLAIKTFMLAVQSPTGDFRTLSPEDSAGTFIVDAALAKNVPPIVPTGGVTS